MPGVEPTMEFSTFFRSEQHALLRYCWLVTQDVEVAADVAQETMERAYRAWGTLGQPGQNPVGWTRRVATNLSRSRWRRVARLTARLPLLLQSPTPQAVEDPALQEALGRLARRQREAVVLRYWADLPLAQCAEVMGVSRGSVVQHLSRAHKRLSGLLDPSILEELVL